MNRMMFTAAETEDTGDNMQIVTGKDRLQITIEEPWAGSTETGFGYTCHMDLTKEQAKELADFINAWLA